MVATNRPITVWMRRSSMKFQISRGPSWFAASDSTTTVIETTREVMVIMPASSVDSRSRAVPASPL
jgi:hypothetical protein